MALTTPLSSPGVHIREIDLTGGVPNVQSTTGAFVGDFRWGPSGVPTRVSNENELVALFGSPAKTGGADFWSAAYFLKYSSSLFVVRKNDSDDKARSKRWVTTVAIDSDGTEVTTEGYVEGTSSFTAKYAGELGNALSVHICPAGGLNAAWENWNATIGASDQSIKDFFDEAPGTSAWAEGHGGENDEIHVAVVDRTGAFTGTPGSVLELYPFVSVAPNALDPQGGPLYIKDVLAEKSNYVVFKEFGDDLDWAISAGEECSLDDKKNYGSESNGYVNLVDAGTPVSKPSITVDLFRDDQYEVDFLIGQGADDFDALVSIAEYRKDCVAVISPTSVSSVNTIITEFESKTASSYAVIDSNHLKVYDKYNDQYVTIPAASSTAGIMAATDLVAAPWFSPAGQRRGQYLGVTDVILHQSKADRDDLYKAGINPVTAIAGQGIVLSGDKTFLRRPSAFDRINVRRLFIVLERAIGQAGANVMFEFNDEFTRAEFVNIVEPVLREVQGRRGITEFKVICDETNNTPAVIDRNEFVASIFIKPARSINFVQLNFVAVRTGVEFEEVVGTV